MATSGQRKKASENVAPRLEQSDSAPLTAGYDVPVPRVTLVQIDGPLKGREFVFDLPCTTIVGREEGCRPDFPKDKMHRAISRHHCLLDINPPDIRVRDLGSMGGTFVNDALIGKRQVDKSGKTKVVRLPECNLHDGDTLRLCTQYPAVFRVKIFTPSLCSKCGFPLPERTEASAEEDGACGRCGVSPGGTTKELKRLCVRCGRDVSDETSHRHGDYTCGTCREKLSLARPGADGPALKGYNVTRLLGRGGMGAVWLGHKNQSEEPAALKVMLPCVAADQRAVLRFLQEINITRALRHTNLVRLLEAGYQQGTFYLALEYCDGGSVGALMKERDNALPVDEAVEITLQALDGLHYAHSLFGPGKPLIHRDIKPDNLFLAAGGNGRIAKIGDYGLAKALDDTGLSGLTRTGETAGTPYFMPRQQVLQFKKPTPEFDVWAMAASLYFMLTRCSPRAFSSQMDRWMTVLETDAVPIRKRLPAVPKRLAEVIDHALIEKPAISFKTAAAFKTALEGAL